MRDGPANVGPVIRAPAGLAAAIRQREGDAGEGWLRSLPALVVEACRQWDCVVSGEVFHGEVALVVPVDGAQGPAVLKVSFPGSDGNSEAEALRLFAGAGAVRLLEASADGYTLLLEKAGPATLESAPTGEAAIEVASSLVRRLAVPAPTGVTSLASTCGPWLEQLDRQLATTPNVLAPRTVGRVREFIVHLATDTTGTMLHGDLHFGNVLAGDREPWLAIDPKGWSGTAAFEAFTVIAGKRHELAQAHDPAAMISDRITRFSRASHLDAELTLRCCQARAASAYLYQLQNHGDWFDLGFLRCLLQL